MRKPRNYQAFDFYTHEHSVWEDKAVEWLEANGFTWQAYGHPSQTIFRATKDGVTADLYIDRECTINDERFNIMVKLFMDSWKVAKRYTEACIQKGIEP